MDISPKPIHASPTAVFRHLDEGGVVLNVDTGAYYELNQTGCFLWEQVEAGEDGDAIVAALAERYGLDLDTARFDFNAFLDELKQRQLVDP